ncbi:MAG: glycosyl transferase, group 1 [Solirubrobacterales bacterium]|nr:glycosyl transferase, group 1 [Solirubrobacterales bacterium]
MTPLAYVVSRFPHVTETFIVRELDGVRAELGGDIELFSLFPPVDPTVHPAAERWEARLHPSVRMHAAAAALAWWLGRRPVRTMSSALAIMREHARAPRKGLRSLVAFAIACAHAREARNLGTRHVHAHYATYPALAGWTLHRLNGTTFSFTAHAHDIYLDTSFLRRLLHDAAFAVPISGFGRGILEAHGGRPEQLHTVHCGVDPGRYAFTPRTLPADGPVRVLCVASLQPYKGHRYLLQALAHQGPPIDRIHLELAGRGELREELEALAVDLGLGHRVTFLGPQTEPEIAAALARADAFVLPSIVVPGTGFTEGIPVSLMEAMAVGLPVIATRVAGVPELVVDGETGLLAEPGAPESLQATFTRLLEEPAAAKAERAHAARAKVEREFDVRESARRMAALLRPYL